MTVLGLGPGLSRIEVDSETVYVVMGWAFRARIPRSSVRSARPGDDAAGGIGVHGMRGRWLVNGSTTGIVLIEIDPPTRAIALGFPVKLHTLMVSAEDPEGLIASL